MKPPSPYKHLDTYQIARRVAKFSSNKLEYLTDQLCTKYKKLSHKKYPGQSLWTECLKGNVDAWNEMKKYNVHDVLSTEELYTKLRAWAPQGSPEAYGSSDIRRCGVCGKGPVELRGMYTTKKGQFPKLHCLSCGAWRKGDKVKNPFI